jgi:subtilisin family serine protease
MASGRLRPQSASLILHARPNRGAGVAAGAWLVGRCLLTCLLRAPAACSHPDIQPNMHPLIGFNALDGSNKPVDDVKHGTHVTGILGAVGNNKLGVAGVNWQVGRRARQAGWRGA